MIELLISWVNFLQHVMPVGAIIILAYLSHVLHASIAPDCMQNKETSQDKLQIEDIYEKAIFFPYGINKL